MTAEREETANRTRVSTPADREIRIEREFDAPRERVFACFTDPGLIPEWWGRRSSTTIVDRLDATTGGDWRFIERDPDGTENAFRGTFREVTPPERIAYTFEWEGMPGYVCVETSEFEDLGGRTRVTSTTIFHTPEERDGMIDAGMETGLNESYEKLDELLARGG